MTYFRMFGIRGDGVLTSPTRISSRWPSRWQTATCEEGHRPPDPGCMCGIYVWTRWTARMCQHGCPPRAFAEVAITGPVLPDPTARIMGPNSRRVRSAVLLRLWVPSRQHCWPCTAKWGRQCRYCEVDWGSLADLELGQVRDATVATLGARYGVPVGRLP